MTLRTCRAKWAVALAGSVLAVAGFAAIAHAEEGMWTFDNAPVTAIEQAYGVRPDQAWLDRVRLGSVRLTSGCSASIVSAEGLVQTNHHCVVDCLQNLSRPGEDILTTGMSAATRDEERQCAGWRAQTLTSIADVTSDVLSGSEGLSGEAFINRRDAAIAGLEAACKGDAADRVCEVVELYQGGRYALYAYKQYDDVRLVFAPEQQAAFFGGDPDNFSFPRYAFDVAFIRLYENGAPAATPNRLNWRSEPLADGELTFVSGHPGSTSRLDTTAQLAFARDYFLPWRLATLSELRGRLLAYSAQGPEQARAVADTLFGVENSFKALNGRRMALVDPVGYGRASAAEQQLQARIQRNRQLVRLVGESYADIETAMDAYRGFMLHHQYLEQRAGGGSLLFWYARQLVRAADAQTKPEEERELAYSPARLPTTRAQVLAPRAVEPELERILLSFWLEKMREYLTADDPVVRAVLGQESPEALAARLVAESRLADPAAREALWDGGPAAVDASADPLIALVKRFDEQARAVADRQEREVEAPISQAQDRLAQARFRLLGEGVYPDATFTLRLSYGQVRGWTEPTTGRDIPAFTYTSGLWERATGFAPFDIVPSWAAARDRLDPTTPFNLVSTQDIIGGNSGSPLLDRDGRVVGAVFDGNLHSLGGEYFYDGRLNRTVSVAATIIEEALVDVYGRQDLVDDLKR